MIEEAPLQTYCSALFFAPAKTLVQQRFYVLLPLWIQRVLVPRSNWSLAILSLHGDCFFGGYLSCSPYGKLLAAATIADITVWNA
jgi:hypothetical protein